MGTIATTSLGGVQISNQDKKQKLTCATSHSNDTTCQRNQRLFHRLLVKHEVLVVAIALISLLQTTLANPVFVDNPNLAQFQSGRNIRHLPCIVRKSGRSGVCMFAIDCIKQNGTHLGTCIDRFYFGSCCQMKEEAPLYAQDISDNSIDQNTISHFGPESTTLPTSALFKLTVSSQQQHVHNNEVSKNISSTSPLTTLIDGELNLHPTLSSVPHKRPTSNTTHHKTSQFVVRTTARPSTMKVTQTTMAPPPRTTTKKPTKPKTTVAAPILTTNSLIEFEQRIESTTLPQKFFTFQIVETTTPTTSETIKHEVPLTTPRPIPMVTNAAKPTTTTSTTTHKPTTEAPVKTTTHPKPPHSTRRPATTKKPTQTKRPVAKPTRKTTTNTTHATQKPTIATTTIIVPPTNTLADTVLPINTTTSTSEKKTTPKPSSTTTTRAPRPKPKPTAAIFKVPRPTQLVETTTTKPTPTSNSSFDETKKTPVPSRPKPSTTKKPVPTSTTITTTTTTTTSTTTTTTTQRPKTTPTSTSTTTTTTKTPPTESATMVPPQTNSLTSTTTHKPGLVTWTNFDREPTGNATNISEEVEDWHPRPPPADWVPVPTITPETLSNKTTITAMNPELTESSSTEKIIVSVSSSISESVTSAPAVAVASNNISLTTTTPSTTTTERTTTTTSTERPTISTPKTTPSTTESSTLIDMSTEGIIGSTTTIGSTTMYATEDYNGTLSSSTAAPTNSLEGVDYKEICGRRMFPEPRIVGGSNAAFGRWPWQISLRQWRTSTYLHKCGAALLNENWAITAAHCVDNVPPSDLLLRLGEYDLAEEEEPYGYQERRVQIVASHPQFDPRTFEYDLALLRFYEPVVFQPNIIPVCVPDSDQNFIGQTAFVTGWGRLYEDGPLPSVLQEVAVPVINNTICETMYRSAGYIEHIPHIFICAGWKKGGYDSCEGDSGGPMVLQREDDKRFQLGGVISWGIGCAEPNQPGVYTRISEFRDWINQILQF